MPNILGNLQPTLVWNIFEEITKHPRPSKKEEKIVKYIEDFAKERNLQLIKDEIGNMIIRKPATKGMEARLPISIQAHVDMVCEKNRDVEFDFDNDPLNVYIDGDWVKARGTTLGADNGIGLAMGMAILASDEVAHPDYELLCTLDEETGLTGAIQLGKGLLNAKILINLDSEEDGHFTIGCAGGLNTNASYSYIEDALPQNHKAYELTIKGLRGGHSGIEINDGRANSAVLLTRLLWNLSNRFGIRLSSINSGNKHNAIPREGFAVITVSPENENALLAYIQEYDAMLKKEWGSKEANINAFATACDMPNRVLAQGEQDKVLNSFYAMPHGVIRMSPDIEGLVQTSMNFAIIETKENSIEVLTSQRSSVETEKKYLSEKVEAIYRLAGAKVTISDGYPAWEPNINSPILNIAEKIYKDMYGQDAVIEAIHAGLECGLVGEKYPGMDMLSFGPTLKEVHTPDEKVQISTVEKCWNLLLEIIKNTPNK